jgi:tetratricopeptide (TPR) repeat protein
MYPDRAIFQRMVNDELNLSGAGRETLLALYEGPLHLRQILDIVNKPDPLASDKGGKDQNISESALRKRLEVLITRGMIARAGSERTNPYYYIRRPWIFNQYILIKCRDGPSSGLLDLTILLHKISHMTAEGDATLPHPRYLSAAGERTERSHQIETAYREFQKILGNKSAIGDYLEGIYEDIYKGKVPESDIDGLLARDFLRFVATAPDEEREVRFFLWYADFFHIIDRYQEAYNAFLAGVERAGREGLDLPGILAETRITKGHILLHLNDFAGAKEAFFEMYRDRNSSLFVQAKNLFGVGEAELFCGDIATPYAPTRFAQALELCNAVDPARVETDVQDLRADILRRSGTIHRFQGRLDEADSSYQEAEHIFRQNEKIRGLVQLLPEKAELLRARAFSSGGTVADQYLTAASETYDEAKVLSQRIRTINWFAHCMIGECELARVALLRCNTPLPRDLDTKYANAFEIYCQISSRWGIVQTFISEALLYQASSEAFPDKYAVTADKIDQAERFSRELGLKTELALIKRIKSRTEQAPELNPLTFL